MSVVTAFEDVGPCQKKLTIEVPAPAVDAEWGRVVGKLRRELQLPGFRKGKVPVGILRQRFGDDIRQEVLDALLPRYWRQAQAEKNLDPLLPPKVEDLELEQGKPMSFVASVEVRPEIEIGEIGELDLPEEDTSATDEDVEEALLDLRRQHATWHEVDRAAAVGDLVMGQMVPVGAEDDEEAKPRPIYLEVGGQGVDEELSLALTGLKPGGSTEYTHKIEAEGETKEEVFRIEAETVKEQELPAMDDELAGRFGLESVEKLEEAVRERIAAGKADALGKRREQALLEQLRQRYPLDLPAGVVQHEGEQMVQRNLEQMSARGQQADLESMDWGKILDDVRPHAERRVHEQLLLDAIAAHQELRLDEQEFETFLHHAAQHQGTNSLALRQRLAENGQIEDIRAQLLRGQVVRQLLGDGPEEAEGEAEGETEGEDTATE